MNKLGNWLIIIIIMQDAVYMATKMEIQHAICEFISLHLHISIASDSFCKDLVMVTGQHALLHPNKLPVTHRRHHEAVNVFTKHHNWPQHYKEIIQYLDWRWAFSVIVTKELISDNFLSYNTLAVHATTLILKLGQNGKNLVHLSILDLIRMSHMDQCLQLFTNSAYRKVWNKCKIKATLSVFIATKTKTKSEVTERRIGCHAGQQQ